jgi:CRP-like cAMP-binding protein
MFQKSQMVKAGIAAEKKLVKKIELPIQKEECLKESVTPQKEEILEEKKENVEIEDKVKTRLRKQGLFKTFFLNKKNIDLEDEEEKPQPKVDRKYTINPDGAFKQGWETFNLLCLIFTFAYMPVRMSFLFKSEVPIAVYVIEKIIDAFYFCDLILAFFTPTIVGFETAYKLKAIAKEYFKFWFWIDLVTILPTGDLIDHLYTGNEDPRNSTKAKVVRFALFTKGFRIFRLIKFVRAFKVDKRSKHYLRVALNWLIGDNFVSDFLNSLVIIIIIIHMAGCFWYFVGTAQPSNVSWLTLGGFQDQGLFDKYIVSIYFAVQTFTTTGYGDIPSKTEYEVIVRVCFICTGALVFSVFTGQVADYKAKATEKEELYAARVQKLESIERHYFDKKNQHHQKLMLRVRSELNSLRDEDEDEDEYDFHFDKLDFLNLNEEEKDRFYLMMYGKRYGNIGLLKDLFENPIYHRFFIRLGHSIKTKSFGEEEIIYNDNDPAEYFYVLLKGRVQFCYIGIEEVPVYEVRSGYFGEYELVIDEFLPQDSHREREQVPEPYSPISPSKGRHLWGYEYSETRRNYTVKAFTPCRVLMIDRKMFKLLMFNHPDTTLIGQLKSHAIRRQKEIDSSYDKISQKIEVYMDKYYQQVKKNRKHSGQELGIHSDESFDLAVKYIKMFFARHNMTFEVVDDHANDSSSSSEHSPTSTKLPKSHPLFKIKENDLKSRFFIKSLDQVQSISKDYDHFQNSIFIDMENKKEPRDRLGEVSKSAEMPMILAKSIPNPNPRKFKFLKPPNKR